MQAPAGRFSGTSRRSSVPPIANTRRCFRASGGPAGRRSFSGQTRPQEVKGVRTPEGTHPQTECSIRFVSTTSMLQQSPSLEARPQVSHISERFRENPVILLKPRRNRLTPRCGRPRRKYSSKAVAITSEGQPKQSSGLALLDTDASGPPCHIVQRKCHNVAPAQAVGAIRRKMA